MANEIATARAGLKTRLETITGLTVNTYASLPITQFPMALIRDAQGPRLLALGGNSFHARFKVSVILNHPGNETEGWTEIEKYCEQVGTYSVPAAILADKTLNASVDWSKVEQDGQMGKVALDDQGPVYYGADFVVDVYKQVT